MKIVVLADGIEPRALGLSSDWLLSTAEMLSRIFDEVHVPVTSSTLDGGKNDEQRIRLRAIANVVLHDVPADDGSHAEQVEEKITSSITGLARDPRVRAVITRGRALCERLASQDLITSKLWSFFESLSLSKRTDDDREALSKIATHSRRLLVENEASRAYLEALAPAAAGKTIVLPPVIDSEFVVEDSHDDVAPRQLRLIYTGRLPELPQLLELLSLPQLLRDLGIESALHIFDDRKSGNLKRSSSEISSLDDALAKATASKDNRVTWHTDFSDENSRSNLTRADIGLCWPSEDGKVSLGESDLVLGYSMLGTPPLLTINSAHVDKFGADYPLFIRKSDSVQRIAERIAAAVPELPRARTIMSRLARMHSPETVRENFRLALDRAGVLQSFETGPQKTKLLVASHDFKFLGELMDQLQMRPDIELRVDRWAELHQHDEAESQRLVEWADTVFVEWAGPALVWYAKNKRPGQRLIGRLHGFEIRRVWPKDPAIANVDVMVFVSEFYRNLGIRDLSLSPEQTAVIPNFVDLLDFDRPKDDGAQFHIGLVGVVGFGKRPDRALDLLEILIEADDRYVLHIKGRFPWDYPHEWRNLIQRQLYLQFFARIAQNDRLKDRVRFEPFSADVATWMRRVGVVISPSRFESFHLSPAEGMASRACAVVWDRDAARDVFGDENVVRSTQEAADRILALRDNGEFKRVGESARNYARAWDVPKLISEWNAVLSLRTPKPLQKAEGTQE